MARLLRAADLFCGAGGTTAGAEATGGCRVEFAVNHWDVAVRTHSANFPHAKHVNSRLDQVNPGECGRIDALFASPECTHHSRARGGRPTSDQQRAGAWDVMKWIEYHRPAWTVVENVTEFAEWGPVGRDGRPMKRFKGRFFQAWIEAIRSAGYSVDWRRPNAADFGAATSRERLFVIARRGTRAPVFPEPSHSAMPGGELPGFGLPRWRAAAEVIDWKIPCPSIFTRKRPLADKTLARIEAGLRRFVGPFVAQWDNHKGNGSYVRSLDRPLGTMTTKANMGLAVPYQVILRNNQHSETVENPLGTICTSGAHHGVAVPYMVPFFGERNGQPPRCHDLRDAMPCVTSHGAGGVAVPFMLGQQSGAVAREMGDVLPTIATDGAISLSVPFLCHYYGTHNMSATADPLDTITAKERHALTVCRVCGFPPSVSDPSPAMQSLLRTMAELGVADIGFRMLANHELSGAQGFAPGYVFHGTKTDVTRQIGNSVSPPQAQSITEAILAV